MFQQLLGPHLEEEEELTEMRSQIYPPESPPITCRIITATPGEVPVIHNHQLERLGSLKLEQRKLRHADEKEATSIGVRQTQSVDAIGIGNYIM